MIYYVNYVSYVVKDKFYEVKDNIRIYGWIRHASNQHRTLSFWLPNIGWEPFEQTHCVILNTMLYYIRVNREKRKSVQSTIYWLDNYIAVVRTEKDYGIDASLKLGRMRVGDYIYFNQNSKPTHKKF